MAETVGVAARSDAGIAQWSTWRSLQAYELPASEEAPKIRPIAPRPSKTSSEAGACTTSYLMTAPPQPLPQRSTPELGHSLYAALESRSQVLPSNGINADSGMMHEVQQSANASDNTALPESVVKPPEEHAFSKPAKRKRRHSSTASDPDCGEHEATPRKLSLIQESEAEGPDATPHDNSAESEATLPADGGFASYYVEDDKPVVRRKRAPSNRSIQSPSVPTKIAKRPESAKRPTVHDGQKTPDGGVQCSSRERPFPCILSTYGCKSTFGSANEWKRHINTQHMRFGFWRCDECPHGDRKPNDFNRKDLFIQHVRRMHLHAYEPAINSKDAKRSKREAEEDLLKEAARRCYMELRTPPEFTRCIFCKAVFEGTNTWEERMTHIGKHLEAAKKDGEPPMDLRDWAVDEDTERWLAAEGVLVRHRGLFVLADLKDTATPVICRLRPPTPPPPPRVIQTVIAPRISNSGESRQQTDHQEHTNQRSLRPDVRPHVNRPANDSHKANFKLAPSPFVAPQGRDTLDEQTMSKLKASPGMKIPLAVKVKVDEKPVEHAVSDPTLGAVIHTLQQRVDRMMGLTTPASSVSSVATRESVPVTQTDSKSLYGRAGLASQAPATYAGPQGLVESQKTVRASSEPAQSPRDVLAAQQVARSHSVGNETRPYESVAAPGPQPACDTFGGQRRRRSSSDQDDDEGASRRKRLCSDLGQSSLTALKPVVSSSLGLGAGSMNHAFYATKLEDNQSNYATLSGPDENAVLKEEIRRLREQASALPSLEAKIRLLEERQSQPDQGQRQVEAVLRMVWKRLVDLRDAEAQPDANLWHLVASVTPSIIRSMPLPPASGGFAAQGYMMQPNAESHHTIQQVFFPPTTLDQSRHPATGRGSDSAYGSNR